MTRLSRRRVLTIAACVALAGPAPARPAPRVAWRGTALGADVRILLDGPGEITRPALARARLEIEAFEARFSLHRPASDLVRLNARGSLPDVDARWDVLLAACDRLHRGTGGRFDPTIQPLWAAHAQGGDVAGARARVGWDRVQLPAPARRGITLAPGQALSFNGIAQGAATDAVRAVLRAAGLTRVLVDIGETAALGGPWTVGAADPSHGVYRQVQLTDAALAVSSPGALRLAEGAAHILDPTDASGPVWSSVAVVADSAALADGLSTAACLMPEAELRALAGTLPGVRSVFLLDEAGAVRTVSV